MMFPVAGLREKLDELEASIQAELSKVGCYIDSFISLVQLFTFIGWKRKLSLLPHQLCGILFLPVLN